MPIFTERVVVEEDESSDVYEVTLNTYNQSVTISRASIILEDGNMVDDGSVTLTIHQARSLYNFLFQHSWTFHDVDEE